MSSVKIPRHIPARWILLRKGYVLKGTSFWVLGTTNWEDDSTAPTWTVEERGVLRSAGFATKEEAMAFAEATAELEAPHAS